MAFAVPVAPRSPHDFCSSAPYGHKLTLVQKDATHFDFILELQHPHIAKIVIRDVDVGLMTPSLPDGAKEDDGLRRIALTDRQWNRQQVRFDPGSPHLEVSGGDGFERANLYTAELAKNCLNAGLWEVLQLVRIGADLIEQLVDQARFDLAPEHPGRTDNGGTQLLADQSRGEVLIIVDRLQQPSKQSAIAEKIGTHGNDHIGGHVQRLDCGQKQGHEGIRLIGIDLLPETEDLLELIHQQQQVGTSRQRCPAQDLDESPRSPA